jgi:hypothetical protein
LKFKANQRDREEGSADRKRIPQRLFSRVAASTHVDHRTNPLLDVLNVKIDRKATIVSAMKKMKLMSLWGDNEREKYFHLKF